MTTTKDAVAESAIHQWKFKSFDTWNDCTAQEFKIRVEDGYITRTLYATQPAPSGDAVEVLREQLKAAPFNLSPHLAEAVARHVSATSRAATVAKEGGKTGTRPAEAFAYANKVVNDKMLPQFRGQPKPEARAANQQAGEVKVERDRVWIVRGTQSFMLAYEADTQQELNWYASQLRNALVGFTPDVKTWRERYSVCEPCNWEESQKMQAECRDAEIADLRTRLAAPISEGTGTSCDSIGELYARAAELEKRNAAPAACNGGALTLTRYGWSEAYIGDTSELVEDANGTYVKFADVHTYVLADRAARAGTGSAGSGEPCAPAILEALSYHGRERDDLTLDDAVKAFRFGYKEVRQRDDRAMLAQIIHLLASAPEDTRATKVEAAPGNAGEGVA